MDELKEILESQQIILTKLENIEKMLAILVPPSDNVQKFIGTINLTPRKPRKLRKEKKSS